jgi:aspartate-semialdehyde dehydrogenase
MKVAVVGSTGMVGQVMLKVLEERNFPVTELIPVASEKSVGKKVKYKQTGYCHLFGRRFYFPGIRSAFCRSRHYGN